MSWRTLIEFNHDLADANDLTDLLAEVFRNFNIGPKLRLKLLHSGATVISTRHHQDGHYIIASDGSTRREVSWDPKAGTLIIKSEAPAKGEA